MDSESTREDVEERLRDTSEAMSDRFSSLQDEVSSTSASLRDWVVENPWKSVGGMLAAGVAVGAFFGARRSDSRSEHAELLDRYTEVLRHEMEEALDAGQSPGDALESVLRDRVPLVVLRPGGEEKSSRSSGSLLGSGIGFVLRTIFREVVRDMILSMLDDAEVEEVLNDLSQE